MERFNQYLILGILIVVGQVLAVPNLEAPKNRAELTRAQNQFIQNFWDRNDWSVRMRNAIARYGLPEKQFEFWQEPVVPHFIRTIYNTYPATLTPAQRDVYEDFKARGGMLGVCGIVDDYVSSKSRGPISKNYPLFGPDSYSALVDQIFYPASGDYFSVMLQKLFLISQLETHLMAGGRQNLAVIEYLVTEAARHAPELTEFGYLDLLASDLVAKVDLLKLLLFVMKYRLYNRIGGAKELELGASYPALPSITVL